MRIMDIPYYNIRYLPCTVAGSCKQSFTPKITDNTPPVPPPTTVDMLKIDILIVDGWIDYQRSQNAMCERTSRQ